MNNIQWYPGHMTKTKRKIKESLPLVDLVVEIIDARIPVSSRNPDLDALVSGKPRIVLLNKSDIADKAATDLWVEYFRKHGLCSSAVDCKSGYGLNRFSPLVHEVLAERIEHWKQRGMVNRAIKMMIAGIPNSGKSSFINRMTRSSKAKVEDRPGVTRGNQWYVTADGFQLLDTPGVLWPKFDDQKVAINLALTGAIRDEVLNVEELACELLTLLKQEYWGLLVQRYKLPPDFDGDGWELLQLVGRKRGMLMPGNEVNTERAAIMLLDEFRAGKIGRITLERPLTQHERVDNND